MDFVDFPYKLGKKTVEDYAMEGGLKGKFFAYGLHAEDKRPAVYEVKGLVTPPGTGLEATLEVIRIDKQNKGEKMNLNLQIHKSDPEAIPIKKENFQPISP